MSIALVTGIVPVLFFSFFLVSEGIAALLEGKPGIIPLLVMMLFTLFGYIWSFKSSKTGGIIMITGSIVMGVYLLFMGGMEGWKLALSFSVPFILPGILLMVSTKHRHSQKS